MTDPRIPDEPGLVLLVDLEMYPTDAGGRRKPIAPGYWPLLVVRSPLGEETLYGLCRLFADAWIAPGTRATVVFLFKEPDAGLAQQALEKGTDFELTEPPRRIARGRVLEVLVWTLSVLSF